MNFIAFVFAIAGAALNFFLPVISEPVAGSDFTGSMYNAVIAIFHNISENGLHGGENTVIVAILIFAILCLIPIVAALHGLCALFNKGYHVKRNLFLCALISGLIALGIYYVPQIDLTSSEFLSTYIIPYARNVSFIFPAVWAVCYLIASVFAQNAKAQTQTASKTQSQSGRPVSLSKGQKVDISKNNPGLSKLLVGLGWSINNYGVDFDLDASAFLLGADGKVLNDSDFIFYNNPEHQSGSVKSMGDNRTGGSGSDDEQIKVDLSKVPVGIKKIAFTVTINDAEQRRQNFGLVSSAFIRVVNEANGKELVRYDLSEKFSNETAVIVAELFRTSNGWNFSATGEGLTGGLASLCRKFGVNI